MRGGALYAGVAARGVGLRDALQRFAAVVDCGSR